MPLRPAGAAFPDRASSASLSERCTTRPRSSTIACRVSDSASFACCSTTITAIPPVGDEIADHAHQLLHDDRREALHRLVEQQQARIHHQRAGDREHLLLAAGQLVAVIRPPLLEARKDLVDALDGPAARAAPRPSDAPRRSATGTCSAPAAPSRGPPGSAGASAAAARSAPRQRSAPPRRRVSPISVTSSVVLPMPLRPRSARLSPSSSASDTSSSTMPSP